jgi:hypothetical protein
MLLGGGALWVPTCSLLCSFVGLVYLLIGVPLDIAPFTFCGGLAVAPSMGGTCLTHLGIHVPSCLVLGIVQGILLVLFLFCEVFSSHG